MQEVLGSNPQIDTMEIHQIETLNPKKISKITRFPGIGLRPRDARFYTSNEKVMHFLTGNARFSHLSFYIWLTYENCAKNWTKTHINLDKWVSFSQAEAGGGQNWFVVVLMRGTV